MWEDLLNSKMFWLFSAIIAGLLIGEICRRLLKKKQSYITIGMPFIGAFASLLIYKFVKLNVTFFDVKYTVIGILILLIIGLILGYFMYLYGDKKIHFLNNFTFIYTTLTLVVFYVFFKTELKINTTVCPDNQDIILLLKKEDAGYFDINEDGIGYIGQQFFEDGFRPVFVKHGITDESYIPTPIAIEIQTNNGIAHALCFKSKKESRIMNLDNLIEKGIVKPQELKFVSLKSTSN